jgi:hypothetical protein
MDMSEKMKELYIAQIKAKMDQINPRLANIENPRSFDQIIKNIDGIFLIINQIKEIQTRTSPPITIEPLPDDLIQMIGKTRDIKATNFAIAAADLSIEKIKAISSERKRVKLLDEAKMLIIDARNIVCDPELLNKLEEKLGELKRT